MTAVNDGTEPAHANDAVRRIVELACRAPSVHNTQPWRWRLGEDRIDLFADVERQLQATDPTGRDLALSCGAAIHHTVVAAAGTGYAARLERLPDPDDRTHLATFHLRPAVIAPQAREALGLLEQRCTDRRRFTSWPIPEERLALLAGGARRDGVRVVPITNVTARFRTELIVSRATERQLRDPALAAEQRAWVDRSPVDGVPAGALAPAGAHSRASRFVADGAPPQVPEQPQVESSDGLLALCTDADTLEHWLAAGEVLSELWLAATAGGLSVVPLSQVIEVEETRTSMRHEVLDGAGVPQMLLRIGWQEIGRSELPRSRRRPLEDVLVP